MRPFYILQMLHVISRYLNDNNVRRILIFNASNIAA
ncbi:hypothetical protein MOVI109754_00930 [Moritella viscosa]